MISSLDINFDILSNMLGIVVEKKNPAPSEGETLQLYIPSLLPNIQKTIPTKSVNFINIGPRLFLNAPDCRPRCRVLFKTQNYITGYLEKNSEWVNSSTSEIRTRNLKNDDGYTVTASGSDSRGGSITVQLHEKYKSYYTIGGEKVDCHAPNGRLSKLLFNNDKYL